MEPHEDRSVSEDAVQKEVELTLASLDRMERLEAEPG